MADKPPKDLCYSKEHGHTMANTREDCKQRTKLVTVAELELMKERRDALLEALEHATVALHNCGHPPNRSAAGMKQNQYNARVAEGEAQVAIEAAGRGVTET